MRRITLIVGLLLGLTVVIWLAGSFLLRESRLDARRELRDSSAQLATAHVEDVLARTMAREQHLARMVSKAWIGGEMEAKEVLDVYPKLLFESNLHLVRPHGEIVWSMYSQGVRSPPQASESAVVTAAASLKSSMSECASPGSIGLACIASPVVGGEGELSAVLLAEIDLESEAVDLLSLETLNDDFAITVASDSGIVLASNDRPADAGALDSPGGERAATAGIGDMESSVVPVDLVPGWSVSLQARSASSAPLWSSDAGWLIAAGAAAWALASAVAWVSLVRRPAPLAAAPIAPGNQQRALIERLADDRRRLSQDLGEGAAQSLAALAMTLDGLASSRRRGTRDSIVRARTVALRVMHDLRGLATRLHPPTLSDFGLDAALKSYVNERFAGSRTAVHVAAAGTRVRQDELVDSILFSAAQEVIDGIYEYADARAILITIGTSHGGLDLAIEHDGTNPGAAVGRSKTAQASAFDLEYVRQLVSAIGGTVAIQPARGLGTRVRITVLE